MLSDEELTPMPEKERMPAKGLNCTTFEQLILHDKSAVSR